MGLCLWVTLATICLQSTSASSKRKRIVESPEAEDDDDDVFVVDDEEGLLTLCVLEDAVFDILTVLRLQSKFRLLECIPVSYTHLTLPTIYSV